MIMITMIIITCKSELASEMSLDEQCVKECVSAIVCVGVSETRKAIRNLDTKWCFCCCCGGGLLLQVVVL